jgi:phosphoribosylaminoimidazole-succinocarboxamide synthase
MTAVVRTDLPLRLVRRGKVRDVYAVDDERLLLVTTDRISAFDVVLGETIPYKGAVLTQLTAWWLRHLEGKVSHHLLSAEVEEIVREVPKLAGMQDLLRGRSMLCRRTNVFPVECVVRGYLAGSAWKEYSKFGTLAGEPLPVGLVESARLERPIFSPATKAEQGHDENITRDGVGRLVGDAVAEQLEQLSLSIYEYGAGIAAERGIIIADTKFEFGEAGGSILLVDEVLTPDSSRFWPASEYRAGQPQPSFDKQPLRDYLEAQRLAGRWNGEAPAPSLPADIVTATSQRYLQVYHMLTGEPLDLRGLA